MTQNSIYDRDFPSGVLFPARSSPLVCATDALEVFLRLIGYMYAGASAPAAARRVVQKRIWQPPQSIAVATAADQPLTLGDQHPQAHIVLFVLGVLPQAIKLFGMRGIPWTQVCGGLYLSSFLVIAGVSALARRAERGTDTFWEWALDERTMEEWNIVSFWVVGMVQAGVWAWCVRGLPLPVWDMEAKVRHRGVVWGILIPVWMMFGMIIPLTGIALSMCFFGVLQVAALVSLPYREDYMLFLAYVLPAAFFATKVVPRHLLMIFFALVNLVLSILYYRFRYDPTGTVKPLWAGKLG